MGMSTVQISYLPRGKGRLVATSDRHLIPYIDQIIPIATVFREYTNCQDTVFELSDEDSLFATLGNEFAEFEDLQPCECDTCKREGKIV